MPNKLLNDFNQAKQKLFEHVGFVEDGANYPIDDGFDYYYWKINDNSVLYSENKEELIRGNFYYQTIYEDQYFPQSIFRGKDFTMIIVLSLNERYLLLFIFDNNKEIK